ncbi:hypothetical protein RRG08_050038 [Elysia crispata]|uniref:C2 domain-containing protein n=1 Tax=Elysia crispata TaxID=231223 RepID=A0AAE1BBG9_9GAST|nr:hypothetical protein RRG08_050038 [Elysia crispata]
MFGKKLQRADYSGGVNVLTLCCGFFSKSSSKRKDSDEIPKPHINGEAGLGKENEGEVAYDQISEKKHSEKVRKKKIKTKVDENGEAYQYEEESSSDSEDDVLKQYQSSVARANSIKGGRPAQSKKASTRPVSERTKSSRGSREDLEAGDRLSYNAESDEEQHNHQNHRSPHAGTPNSGGASMQSGDSPRGGTTLTFENQAFMADAGGGGSVTASDRAQSTERLTSDEHLFDVSDLQHDNALISKCGSLEVSFFYDSVNTRMVVKIHQAREIPAKERGGANTTQVRIMLLPSKKQRHKSKIKDGENPVFEEKIYFNKIMPDEVQGMGLRFRLYGVERMRRERMIGESIVGFASLNLDLETTHWVVLEPRSNLSHGDSALDVASLSRSDSGSSNQSLQHGGMPELLLGLAYNGTTGRLSVEVIKGSNFRNMAMNRAPDTYTKLSLMNASGAEVQRCKTSVRRGQPNPLFKETFMLQVALFQLAEVTLMVSVYNKKSMKKKEMVGWFAMGMNSSGEEESAHWQDMRESKGEQVCRWHILLES